MSACDHLVGMFDSGIDGDDIRASAYAEVLRFTETYRRPHVTWTMAATARELLEVRATLFKFCPDCGASNAEVFADAEVPADRGT